MLNVQELTTEVNKIRWYHTIDLGSGIITPGIDNTPVRLKQIALPENLNGMSVLDIGAWDGFFSFEAERRGAQHVLATDSFCWSGEGWGSKAGFDLAKKVLNSKVSEKEIDVMDLSPEVVGTFDLVFFLGLFYHLRHPLLALEHVSSVCKGMLILDTEADMLNCSYPAMAFYPGTELNNDPTNWFGPNLPAVIAALKSVGFHEVKFVYPSKNRLSLPWRLARATKLFLTNRDPFLESLRRGRIIVHAWK